MTRAWPIAVLLLAGAFPALSQEAGQWTRTDVEGAAVASWTTAEQATLVSVGCDAEAGELVFFRAAEPPLEAGPMTLLTETGELPLAALPDPEGMPGLIARAPADSATLKLLATAATLTFRLPADAQTGGLAVPIGDPFREVVEGCGTR